jgi:hypothetical protein
MKRLLLPVLVLLLVGYLAFAEGAPKGGDFGIQGGLNFTSVVPVASLGVKYFINDNIALRAGVGLVNVYNGGTTITTTGYTFAGGFEYHFGVKGGVSPYLGAQVSYSGESISGGAAGSSDAAIRAIVGGEYFFSNNFSWAGELGLGYESVYNGTTTSTEIGTVGASFIITYYL